MSSELKKHVGKIKTTDQRCVVVLLQIPGKEDHALIINTEALPPRYEQSLMEILESHEAQAVQDLSDVLSRRIMPDTGLDVLNTFHRSGLLRPEPVDNIVMLPRPNMPFPLRSILESMGKTVAPPPEGYDSGTIKYNPYQEHQGALLAEQKLGIARNILVEAQDLEAIANGKREQAYKLAPELRPASGSRKPAKPEPQPKAIEAKVAEEASVEKPAKRPGPGRPRKNEVR